MVKLNPYINLKGKTKEAIEFYHSVFGGEMKMTTFKEGGMKVPPEEENFIMHSQLDTPKGLTLMVSDQPSHMGEYSGLHGYSISLSGEMADEAELKGYWEKLSEGAKITQPLVAAPWGDQFGMLQDKFGVDWMVNISGKKA